MEKIAIIGIGGRTGTLFAHKLKNAAEVLGVGREKEIEMMNSKNLLIQKRGADPEVLDQKIIKDQDFGNYPLPDYIFVATRNPVHPVVKHYYQIAREKNGKLPVLILSQNGISAVEEAVSALREVFGGEASNVQIIRLNLFNPVDGVKEGEKVCMKYFEPVRLVFSSAFGSEDASGLGKIFQAAGIEYKEYPRKDSRNMECSKLFLNLIGMAAASYGQSVEKGYQDKAIFREEVIMLREYIASVEKSGSRFLDFDHYPVGLLSCIINNVPLPLLVMARGMLVKIISKGRGNKPKDLGEIDYYNGGVIKLGQTVGIKTPVNIKIYNQAKKLLN
ncbi:MAG: 2-dehydropantoate 2-reductase N-terminal domain-containing protein [Candidatus Paceibacterota bacterium]|jgi:ketopantoate reductase